jgi:fucose 4-O-acetylase-like acetyltransferase
MHFKTSNLPSEKVARSISLLAAASADIDSTTRNGAVDILRGIAIILVVLGHANRGAIADRLSGVADLRLFDWLIYAVHMPIFFYLAGFYTLVSLRRHSEIRFLKSRVSGVIVPYILWSLLYFISSYSIGLIAKINKPILVSDLINIYYDPINVLWFLYALLMLQIIAIFARFFPMAALIISIALDALLLFTNMLDRSDLLVAIVSHAPFFFAGIMIAHRQWPPLRQPKRGSGAAPLVLLALFTLFAIAFYLWGIAPPVQFTTLPLAALGLIGLSSASIWISQSFTPAATILARLGQASLAIYLMHILTLAVVPRLLKIVGLDFSLSRIILGTIVGVGVSYWVYLALERLKLARLLGLR